MLAVKRVAREPIGRLFATPFAGGDGVEPVRQPTPYASPEIELVLRCAGAVANGRRRLWLRRSLDKNIDWQRLIELAGRHGVMPLVYRALERQPADTVPARVLQRLQECFKANAGRNLLLTAELLRLTQLFGDNGVPAVPFKGPTLALSAYGDVAAREFGDLDILVPEPAVAKARDLLLRAGYRTRLSRVWEDAYRRFGHEFDFTSADGGIDVDLQWRLASKWVAFPVDPAALWQRLHPVSIGGVNVPQPPPEDLLLILCGHGYRHCWSRLKWICDIAAFVCAHGRGIDWNALLQRTAQHGGRRILLLGLALAREVLATALPEGIERALEADGAVAKLVRGIMRRLNNAPEGPVGPDGGIGFFGKCWFHLQARERWREKLPAAAPLLAYFVYRLRRYARHYAMRTLGSQGESTRPSAASPAWSGSGAGRRSGQSRAGARSHS